MTAADRISDKSRRAMGFLTLDGMLRLAGGILMPVPASVLVSHGVEWEDGAVIWPNVVLQATGGGTIRIGARARLLPGTRILAADGRVTIGDDAEIGDEGGFTINAEGSAHCDIGSATRLLGGGSLRMSNTLGSGSQILGPIRCRNCRLDGGGSYRQPDPDSRGGVLKGFGVADHVVVPKGHVIQAFGQFSEGTLRPQSFFHPGPGR